MRLQPKSPRPRAWMWCAALFTVPTFVATRLATAQESDEARQEDALEAEPPAQAADQATGKTTRAEVPAEGDSTEDEAWFGVGRLPASAFAPGGEDRSRYLGISGGSLRGSSGYHGLTWPYLPGRRDGVLELGFSGNVWVDSSYRTVEAGQENDDNTVQWLQQSRLVLRATPVYQRGPFFVQGQAEFVANSDQSQPRPRQVLDTDDLYIRVGSWDRWDVQVGRFQAWEIYHLGMGLDLNTFERAGANSRNNTAVELYGVTYAWDRPNSAGNVAVHAYPIDILRFELLGQFGDLLGQNVVAVRGTAILDLGWVKFKGGGEYGKITPQIENAREETERRGVGGSVQAVIFPYAEFGFSLAHALSDSYDSSGSLDLGGSTTTTSFGGFANLRLTEGLLAGGGVNSTRQVNLRTDPVNGQADELTHLQLFGALQYALWDRLYLKGVVAYAKAGFDRSFQTVQPPYDNEMWSGRLRLLMTF